jgi:inner membrane protein
MPTVITHGVIGIGAALAAAGPALSPRLAGFAVVCSVLPDADVAGLFLGVPYNHFFGHRGFFHSLLFALIVGVIAGAVYVKGREPSGRDRLLYVGLFSAIAASHVLLDAMTNGGLGIALLSPLDTSRYFLPWTPIEVAPIGVRAFLSEWGVLVLVSECLWVWLPLAGIILVCRALAGTAMLSARVPTP